jgi:hypothetical protein
MVGPATRADIEDILLDGAYAIEQARALVAASRRLHLAAQAARGSVSEMMESWPLS